MKKISIPFLFLCGSLCAGAGSLDNSFGKAGIVTTLVEKYCSGISIALQSDGKMVVAGTTKVKDLYEFITIAYNPEGAVDTSFGQGGMQTAQIGDSAKAASILVQADDKLVVIGTGSFEHEQMTAVRYTHDGILDRSFAWGGITILTGYNGKARGGMIQPDNKIVITGSVHENGSHLALARLCQQGIVDKTFGFEGVVTISEPESSGVAVGIQKDGKLVVVGEAHNDLLVARFNADGTPDKTFGKDGLVTTHFYERSSGRSVAIQKDGKIVVAGFAKTGDQTYSVLARYCSDGTLDPEFGTAGVVNFEIGSYTKWYSLVLQPNQKIVVAGTAAIDDHKCFALARFNTDGTLDASFDCAGVVTTQIGWAAKGCSVALDQDGNIIVSGNALIDEKHIAIARYIGRKDSSPICSLFKPIMCALCKQSKILCSLMKRLFTFC